MKEVIIYEAYDGTEFRDKNMCMEYDSYIEKANEIMSQLRVRKSDSNYAVRQDVSVVKKAMKQFFDEVAKPLLDSETLSTIMDEIADGSRHPSHIAYIFNEMTQYPILNHTFFRFECINMESGIEYCQPYYIKHENEFKGVIE